MVLGTGIDVMAVSDMQRELAHGPWCATDCIFRASELQHCNAARSPARQLASYFVAKEAAVKALALRVVDLTIFREVEVIGNHESVKVRFHGRAQEQSERLGVRRVLAALHSDRYLAAAMVILEG